MGRAPASQAGETGSSPVPRSTPNECRALKGERQPPVEIDTLRGLSTSLAIFAVQAFPRHAPHGRRRNRNPNTLDTLHAAVPLRYYLPFPGDQLP